MLPDYIDQSPDRRQGTMANDSYGETSPARTTKGGTNRRKTIGAGSPTLRSPLKTKRLGSPDK